MFYLGFDIGGTMIKAGLVDSGGRLRSWEQVPTPASGAEGITVLLDDIFNRLLMKAGLDGPEIKAVGVGVAGAVNPRTGRVRLAPNLGWRDFPLAACLSNLWGRPVVLDNDAHVAALGEMWQGAGRGKQDILLITVGTGIGSALILGGQIHWGVEGRGAELGHVKVAPDGPLCNCGGRGCLETLTAAPAMVRAARRGIEAGRPSLLAGKKDFTAKDILDAARENDELALEVIDRATDYLSLALANAVLLVDPEIIVVGGGVAEAGDIFLGPLRDKIKAALGPWRQSELPLLPAALGNKAGVIGAAYLAGEERLWSTYRQPS
ncbi:MAG: glucokinase [Clostridia bacterium]|nr:glucokinase [Clostridia bacterium]